MKSEDWLQEIISDDAKFAFFNGSFGPIFDIMNEALPGWVVEVSHNHRHSGDAIRTWLVEHDAADFLVVVGSFFRPNFPNGDCGAFAFFVDEYMAMQFKLTWG